jgi:hypothetical protein
MWQDIPIMCNIDLVAEEHDDDDELPQANLMTRE